eukprot:1904452-Pyramimonas_sp.AAC.1
MLRPHWPCGTPPYTPPVRRRRAEAAPTRVAPPALLDACHQQPPRSRATRASRTPRGHAWRHQLATPQ